MRASAKCNRSCRTVVSTIWHPTIFVCVYREEKKVVLADYHLLIHPAEKQGYWMGPDNEKLGSTNDDKLALSDSSSIVQIALFRPTSASTVV